MFWVTECVKITCFRFKSLLAGVSESALSLGALGTGLGNSGHSLASDGPLLVRRAHGQVLGSRGSISGSS